MNKYTRKYFLNIYLCMCIYIYTVCVPYIYVNKLFILDAINRLTALWKPSRTRLLLENKARFLLNERLNLEIHRETEHKEWVSCIFTNSSETE